MTTLQPGSLLEQLHWRYATKRFDASKKIPQETWATLEAALTLSPSSFGLQPWKCIVVTDPALREALKAASWNQPQITECSHLVVFAMKQNLGDGDIDRFIHRVAEVRQVAPDSLKDYQSMMKGFVHGLSPEQVNTWVSRQTYIALGLLLTSAAVLGIDACPMEGLDGDKYDEILGIKGYHTLCVAATGYRQAGDPYSQLPKVRFPQSELIEHRP